MDLVYLEHDDVWPFSHCRAKVTWESIGAVGDETPPDLGS